MSAIDESFAELADTIRKQRVGDTALDEICKDFELLAADLEGLLGKAGDDERRLRNDLRNSLNGLKQEILARVQGI